MSDNYYNTYNLMRLCEQIAQAQDVALDARANGHVWARDENNHIDVWQLDNDIHNGPRCVNCGRAFCAHCNDDFPPCKGKKVN